MGLDRLFFSHRLPRQYLHVGGTGVDVYRVENHRSRKVQALPVLSFSDVDTGEFADWCAGLDREDSGVILNAGYFIYNIFSFQKLPLRQRSRDELILWRLKKRFPEDLEQYTHTYFPMGRGRVFSVLMRRDLRDRIVELFAGAGRPLIFLGNSTVGIMNRLFRGASPPDMFVEYDAGQVTCCFQRDSVPFYIRKFRVNGGGDLAAELGKTFDFVAQNHGFSVHSSARVFNDGSGVAGALEAMLKQREIRERPVTSYADLILPDIR